ncbi:hypothetical protein [uncultured Campylobacter sp.]|nr:hypothetical protein [uncultured Campylobacter sp.]
MKCSFEPVARQDFGLECRGCGRPYHRLDLLPNLYPPSNQDLR